jgi:hypothetical protein
MALQSLHCSMLVPKNELPWNAEMEIRISNADMECVGHLKIFDPREGDEFFVDYSKAQQRIAQATYKHVLLYNIDHITAPSPWCILALVSVCHRRT